MSATANQAVSPDMTLGNLSIVPDKSRVNFGAGTAKVVIRSKAGTQEDILALDRGDDASTLAERWCAKNGLGNPVFTSTFHKAYPVNRLGNMVTTPDQPVDHYRIDFELARAGVL
jgi:hypothetical protein